MTEIYVEPHDSPIKTPRQLITVVVLAFLVPIFGIVLIAQLVTGGLKVDPSSAAMSAEAIAKRLKPVGEVSISVAPDAGGSVADKGKALYDQVCMACHAAGLAGAPKTGDKSAWGPRIATGKSALYNSALKGKTSKTGIMPAKGGAVSAPDADVKAAVDYLVSQVK
jgi:cytochrome c5